MLTVLALMITLQQAVDPSPLAPPAAEAVPAVEPAAASSLPDWALADPFGWERSQCSPLVRGDEPMAACQSRVRAELSVALGERLPPGLSGDEEPTPCLATPDSDGSYPVQCREPERRVVASAAPREQICESRPRREGGAVAFVTECRTAGEPERRGLSIRLLGGD